MEEGKGRTACGSRIVGNPGRFTAWCLQHHLEAQLVEEQVLVAREQADETCRVSGCCAYGCRAIRALEIRLHHLVVLAVTQCHRSQLRTLHSIHEIVTLLVTARKVEPSPI